jgi:hypothetical protein
MSKNRTSQANRVMQTDLLTVRVELEDWVMIEGSAQALSRLASQILAVAEAKLPHLTLDHPGPYLEQDSQYGIIVIRQPTEAR